MAKRVVKKDRIPELKALMRALEEARHARGLNVERVAEKAGISAQAYYTWLEGVFAPKLEHFLMVAKGLGFDVALRTRKDVDSHGGGAASE